MEEDHLYKFVQEFDVLEEGDVFEFGVFEIGETLLEQVFGLVVYAVALLSDVLHRDFGDAQDVVQTVHDG